MNMINAPLSEYHDNMSAAARQGMLLILQQLLEDEKINNETYVNYVKKYHFLFKEPNKYNVLLEKIGIKKFKDDAARIILIEIKNCLKYENDNEN